MYPAIAFKQTDRREKINDWYYVWKIDAPRGMGVR